MKPICLLVSGNLGQTVFQYLYEKNFPIQSVMTNRTSDSIIEFAQQKNIPIFIGNPRKGKASTFIQSTIDCDILLSVNYLYIIEKDLIDVAKKYAINIHGSLLPKYRGRTPHVWAIINGEKETGITAHLIDPLVDKGDIIEQMFIPIKETDTGGMILQKYATVYPTFIAMVLEIAQSDQMKLQIQNEREASYFGKRTPADGQINWSWCKERIYNWIRAQAKPYPGAFTFLKKQKIIIHKAIFSKAGFHQNQANGTILKSGDQIIIKTPNGALEISDLEMENHLLHQLKEGEILS